jgi:sialate O-acetylesterase
MQVPGLWEEQSLKDFDGVVWFRKTINIAAADAGKPAEISLGTIDDNDDTYINGSKVGSTKGYNIDRKYKIPAGVLKEGTNLIAVRVEDTGGGGGMYGNPADMKLTINNTTQSLAGQWMFQVASVLKSNYTNPNSYPTLLYNAMIYPLIPFAIKGALWYQGENNAGRAYQYRKAFPLMITDWRKQWGEGNFPFYFVQLASFNSANGNSQKGSTWAELREAQTLTLSLPKTGMAVTTDIGESSDIHPKNKQDVGKRLAAVALHDTYGKKNIYSGPMYKSMKIEGNKAIVSFSHAGTGLYTKDPDGYIEGFEIAGKDRDFQPAKAVIEGDHIVVSADNVQLPVALRYAWADDAGKVNLFNKEGFPAVPFRTDKWKGITEAAKYKIAQ